MIYIGIDVHKISLQVCVLNESGEKLSTIKIENTPISVDGYFSKMKMPASIALEATHNWGMIFDLLNNLGFEVHICHSKEAKMIGLASVKNDRVDAFKLATLLRVGLLPEAYVPEPGARELRSLVRHRAALKGVSTILKNQIHAILRANWIPNLWSDLFGKAGREFLKNLNIGEDYNTAIVSKLAVLDVIDLQIAHIDSEIKCRAHMDARAMIVTTAPGFGEFRAIMLLAEVVDIKRFPRAESLVCFTGLNPRENSSGEKVRRGKITKEGSRWLRWIFVEAAQHAIRKDGKIRDLYLRVEAKKDHNRAIVAAARELVVSVYWMLTRMEPYHANGKRLVLTPASEVR